MYILNKSSGASFMHPEVGVLPPLTAKPVTPELANKLRHRVGVVIFNDVLDVRVNTIPDRPHREPQEIQPMKRYQDFVAEYKDISVASQKWKEYKESLKDEMARREGQA